MSTGTMISPSISALIILSVLDTLLPVTKSSMSHSTNFYIIRKQDYLGLIERSTIYQKWHCGHYRLNKRIPDAVDTPYEDIIRIQ